MRLHHARLQGELVFVCPVIVALAHRDVPPAQKRGDIGFGDVAAPDLVLGLQHGDHGTRIFFRVGADDLGRGVRGGVVVYDQLERKIRFLAEDALDGVGNGFFVVIAQAHHADQRFGSSHTYQVR